MKRCPECRRDYADEILNFRLDDGSALLEGPGSMDKPVTPGPRACQVEGYVQAAIGNLNEAMVEISSQPLRNGVPLVEI